MSVEGQSGFEASSAVHVGHDDTGEVIVKGSVVGQAALVGRSGALAVEGAHEFLTSTNRGVAALGADATEGLDDGDQDVHGVAELSHGAVIHHGGQVEVQVRGVKLNRERATDIGAAEDVLEVRAQDLGGRHVRIAVVVTLFTHAGRTIIGHQEGNLVGGAHARAEAGRVVVTGDVVLNGNIAQVSILALVVSQAEQSATVRRVATDLPRVDAVVHDFKPLSSAIAAAEEGLVRANDNAEHVVGVVVVGHAADEIGIDNTVVDVIVKAQVGVSPINAVSKDFNFEAVLVVRRKLGLLVAITNSEQVVFNGVVAEANGAVGGQTRGPPLGFPTSSVDIASGAVEGHGGVTVEGVQRADVSRIGLELGNRRAVAVHDVQSGLFTGIANIFDDQFAVAVNGRGDRSERVGAAQHKNGHDVQRPKECFFPHLFPPANSEWQVDKHTSQCPKDSSSST